MDIQQNLPLALLGGTALGGGAWAVGRFGPLAFRPLAERDFFFTYIDSGDGKRIDRGKEFHTFIISLPGYHLNDPTLPDVFDETQTAWEVLPDVPGKTYDHRPKWMHDFGYFPVGIPGQMSVHSEFFEWREESAVSIEGRMRRETTTIFKVNSFPYVMMDMALLTKDKFEVKVIYVVAIRINNPHTALIMTEDWLVQVTAALTQATRNFIGGFDFEQLISLTDESDTTKALRENFAKEIYSLNKRFFGESEEEATGCPKKYGVTIEGVKLTRILPDGPRAEEQLKLLMLKVESEKKGEARVIAARADAEVRTLEGDAKAKADMAVGLAEAEVIKAKELARVAGQTALFDAAEKNPQGAAVIAGAESIGKAGATVVVPTNLLDTFANIGKSLAGAKHGGQS